MDLDSVLMIYCTFGRLLAMFLKFQVYTRPCIAPDLLLFCLKMTTVAKKEESLIYTYMYYWFAWCFRVLAVRDSSM